MKRKILITGGSGFIGKNLRQELSELDYETFTIGRNEEEDLKIDLGRDGATLSLQNGIKNFSPDLVCHFASGSNIQRAEEEKEKEFKNTVIATENLLECLKKVVPKSKIIYLSSQAVYGLPSYLPVDELHLTKPVNIYGENKLKVEKLIIQSGLDYLIFRVSSVFGLNQDYKKSGVIAKFINKMKNNESPIVFNSMDIVSDFIYIKDLVSVISKAMLNDAINKEIFNLGSGKPVSMKELLYSLYKYFPDVPPPKIEKNPLYINQEYKGFYLNINKIRNKLKWACQYSLQDGLKDMLEKSAYEFVN